MSLKKNNRSLATTAVFSGLGMGLLLGMIMGLSISPTVKIVMGSLTAVLGGFLGFDGKLKGKTDDENSRDTRSIITGLRAGSFGFAVIIGLLSGMTIRTNELLAPTMKERIAKWKNAGFTKEEAKKIVLYQKLAIDPVTGEAKKIGDLQRSAMQGLFSSGDKQLSELLDPGLWNSNIETAINEVKEFEISELTTVFLNVRDFLQEDQQFSFLEKLQIIVYEIEENDTNFCDMPDSMVEWTDSNLRAMEDFIYSMNESDQKEIIKNLKSLFCKLETA